MTKTEKGFTLLEILVVVSLMALLMGLFVSQIYSPSDKALQEQAVQFKRQFQVAYSNAQQKQKTLVLLVRNHDYSFVELVIPKKPDETLSFKNFEPFKKKANDSELIFFVEEKEGFDWSDSAFAPLLESVEEQLGDTHMIFILPNGQISPEFDIGLQQYDDPYMLRYIGHGQFEDEYAAP